jgi:prepilin-type N-terminal cleavage/methylation domain
MKKNGFTLIELLGVLIILAILALITIPLVTNSLQKAEKESFKNSIEGIIRTMKNNSDEYNYEEKIYLLENGVLTTTDGDGVKVKVKTNGGAEENGSFIIDEDGIIKGSANNGQWCAKKTKETDQLQITDYLENTCYVD